MSNRISEKSRREIASKVSKRYLIAIRNDPKKRLDTSCLPRLLLLETGYPVDGRDFESLLRLTLDTILNEWRK